MISIIDAELSCIKCGQKIKLKHLNCQKEKREMIISRFNSYIDWIEQEYNENGKISITHYLERVRQKIREGLRVII